MECRDLIAGLGFGSFGLGLILAFVYFAAYSDFLARLQLVAPKLVEDLEMEMGDRWSRRNVEIWKYFWCRRYEFLGDNELDRIGGRIRRLGCIGPWFGVFGIMVLAAKAWVGSMC